LLVFLSLVFWLWLWGPLGGFIAIPLLIWGLAIAGQLGHPEPDPRLRQWTGLGNPGE
jgi:predicted PurR-regulated permease PerM